MTVTGVDYAWLPHPSPSQIASAGYSFAGRYLDRRSPLGGNNGKVISVPEKDALLGAGLAVVIFGEWGAADMTGGAPAGDAAAVSDAAQLALLGMDGCPVYSACDYDAAPADQPAIDAYLAAYAARRGWACTGLYGGYWPLSRARAALPGLAFLCGSPAWSADLQRPGHTLWESCGWIPHIMQGAYPVTVGGIQCDRDTVANAADYGQWPRPGDPPPPPPAFPYPAADYLGVQSPDPHCHSGYYAADRPHIQAWQQQMADRGWAVTADGIYGSQSQAACAAFQAEKGLAEDGLVGPVTWMASWTAPVT